MRFFVSFFAVCIAGVTLGDVALKTLAAFTRASGEYPKSTSGITYAGGDLFYAVADDRGDLPDHDGGLYAYRIAFSNDGKKISLVSHPKTNEVVKLENGYDQEGCAYDPATGYVWVSDEVRKSIGAFDPKTGELKESLDYPEILNKANGNYAVEGLTISGDGLTMWFANEEALACDGARSSYAEATTVRLFRFTRENVHAKFTAAGQYPYTTEKWKCQYDYKSTARHGVSGLCALPDGSLLVLERDLSFSSSSAFTIFLGASNLGWSVYRVSNPQWAMDVTAISSLAADASWTAVDKSLLASGGADLMSYGNFEGICLGPRLNNGNVSVLLISDAGDGYSQPMIQPLVLSGLNIHTVDFPAPSSGDVASLVGSNYRFLDGSQVNVTIQGEGLAPVAYTNRGSRVATASWSLQSGKSSGTGNSAVFTVSGDDSFVWSVASSLANTPVVASDTFEDVRLDAIANAGSAWTGSDIGIVAQSYAMPLVGPPMQRTTHTNVLSVKASAMRTYATTDASRYQLDMMTQVMRESVDVSSPITPCQMSIWFALDGRCHVIHADADGRQVSSVASETRYDRGTWVRVSLSFDYTSLNARFTLRLDGTYCGEYLCLGSARKVSGLIVTGDTALDDVILTEGDPAFEVAQDASSTLPVDVSVPQIWLDRYGVAWYDIDSDVDSDGFNVWQEYLGGTSPVDGASAFAISDFQVTDDSIVLAFTGELPCPDLLKVKCCTTLDGPTTTLEGVVTTENGVSVWRASLPAEAHFFRAYLAAGN